MTTTSIPVWYASEERAQSRSKLLVLDDRGLLEPAGRGFRFTGQKQQFLVADIQRVSLEAQRFPWKTWIVADAGLLAIFALGLMVSMAQGELAGAGQAAARLGAFVVLLALMNAAGFLIGRRGQWVRVDHGDENGCTRGSYFAVSAQRGWSNVLGGSQRLYAVLSSIQHAAPPSLAASSVTALGVQDTIQRQFGPAEAMPATSAWDAIAVPLAVLSLLLGIASVVLICFLFPLFVTSPAAIVTGHVARYGGRQSRDPTSGAGFAMAGLVLGYVTLIVPIGFIILLIIGPIQF